MFLKGQGRGVNMSTTDKDAARHVEGIYRTLKIGSFG